MNKHMYLDLVLGKSWRNVQVVLAHLPSHVDLRVTGACMKNRRVVTVFLVRRARWCAPLLLLYYYTIFLCFRLVLKIQILIKITSKFYFGPCCLFFSSMLCHPNDYDDDNVDDAAAFRFLGLVGGVVGTNSSHLLWELRICQSDACQQTDFVVKH